MSITKRILLNAGFGAALVLAIVAFVTYRSVFAAAEQRVAERTEDLNQALAREKELSEIKSSFVSMVSQEFAPRYGTRARGRRRIVR